MLFSILRFTFGIEELEDYIVPKFENQMYVDNKNLLTTYMVGISNEQFNYCVGLVDMVNSTKIAATLGNGKIARYYQIFLNSMSKIISRFGGQVIKNVGDCLVYYFPESSKSNRKYGFMNCLECSLAMTESRNELSNILTREGLPCIDYRVSADYGSVTVMKTSNSSNIDLIGPPLNMCSKINRIASPNSVVIGSDLYETAKKFNRYKFKATNGCSVGFKHSYPVYQITRNKMSWF